MSSATPGEPPPPTESRVLLALHVGCAAPLVALAVWFGLIDPLPAGAGRCSSCGVEGYVIAAHVVAAIWLGAIVALTAAERRRAREGVAAPGPVTVRALAAVALFATASLVWHPLFGVPAFVAMLASVILFPFAIVWWLIRALAWARHPRATPSEWQRRTAAALAASWLSLTLLLPALFAWVWADRVEWLVF